MQDAIARNLLTAITLLGGSSLIESTTSLGLKNINYKIRSLPPITKEGTWEAWDAI